MKTNRSAKGAVFFATLAVGAIAPPWLSLIHADADYASPKFAVPGGNSEINKQGEVQAGVNRQEAGAIPSYPGEDSRLGQDAATGSGVAHSGNQAAGTAPVSTQNATKTDERAAVGPHAIMVHTSLQSAKDEVNGIKSQLKADAGAAPSMEAVEHLKMYSRAINTDVKTAEIHEKELKSAATTQFPNLTKSDQYQMLSTAVGDVATMNKNWQDRTSDSTYWKNTAQVNVDLDQLSKRIDKALDQSKDFGSSQLNVTFAG